jgi:hypothetical protein
MPVSMEANMQMAIEAYKSKKMRPQSRVAAVFGVSLTTLRARLKGRQSRTETRANSHKLTEYEEKTLLTHLLDADKRGFAIRPEYLREMAQILLRNRTQNPTMSLGINWPTKFINRHPEIKTRFNRRISYQRAKQEDPRIIRGWINDVEEAIQEYGIHEDDIWNFDETGFAMGLCTTSKVITSTERSERPRTVIQGNREWVTIVECISSGGHTIPPLIILKGKEHQATWYQELLLPTDWKIAMSPNGWTNDLIGLCWLKTIFEPFSKQYSKGAKRLLILDGHSSHLTAEFDLFCKENAIICLCMPPHSSHLLQPLDVGLFGPLKRAYGKLVEQMMVAGNNHIDKQDFLSLYPTARKAVFTQDNIYGGFAGAGLKPLDIERVLAKITFCLHTPTPSPLLSSEEGSISSNFQTPTTTRQLDHKYRTLQKSLTKKRRLSSSPAAHIRSLKKAVDKSICKNLLLEQRVKVLEAENKRKKAKNARRRATLGTDIILSVQEGQDRVQQLDIQVESYSSSLPRPRAPPRCSGCRSTGHTIRTCPNK